LAGRVRAIAETVATCPDAGIVAKVVARTACRLSVNCGGTAPATLGLGDLSPREREVLRLLASDLSRQLIARELFVSHDTIKTQTQSIYRMLRVSNPAEAVARSRDDGII
jgi:LuxR family maltose regulon positive regulatory protein